MNRKRQLLAWVVTFVMVLSIIPNISLSVFGQDYNTTDAWEGRTLQFGDVIKDINYGKAITIQYGEFIVTNPSNGNGYFKSYYSDTVFDPQGITVWSPEQFAVASGIDVASWKPGFKIVSWKVWRLTVSGGDPTGIMMEPNWEKLEVGKSNVVAIPGDQKVTLNWDAAENATDYKVYSGANQNTCTTEESVVVNTVSDSVYSCDITNLTNGNTYCFKVVARNSYNGNETSADIVSAIPFVKPEVPENLVGVEGRGYATLSWNEVENATGYKIYKSINSGTYATEEVAVAGNVFSCDISNLTNGVAYYFVVKAVNDWAISDASNEVNVIPKGVPASPTGVTAVAGNAQATISFGAPVDNGGSSINKYIVTSNPDGVTAEGATSPITVEGLTNGTAYTFTVKAVNAIGMGSEGSTVGFTTPKRPQSVGSITISGVTATAASFKASYISDDILDQQGFRYKKSTDNNSSWKELPATAKAGELTATVSGLTSGTAYDVKGYIHTAAGETQTQVVSFTTVKSSSGGSDNPGDSGNSSGSDDSSDSDSSNDSGSSSNSGSTGGSGSAGGTSTTGNTAVQQVVASIDKAIEQCTTPTVAVDATYNAQVPVEALEAIAKAGQDLVVQSGSVGVAFNVQAIETLLGNKNTATPVQITTAPIAPKALEQITKELAKAQGETILGGSDLTLDLSVKSTQQLDTFVEPLDVKLDLSKINVKDASKLTLVRYETQKDGSVTAVKLGGKYDEKTKSFSAKTNGPGLYGVMEVENLTQITLKLDHNEIELNGKKIKNDVAPEIINDLTMMPLRSIVESLGATVEWDDTLKHAIVMLNGKTLIVGKEQGLFIKEKEGRTLVPVRFISEQLGANVLWIPSTRQVQIVR